MCWMHMQMCLGWRPQRLACSAACRGHSSSTALGIQQCPTLPQQPGSTRAHPSYPPHPTLGGEALRCLPFCSSSSAVISMGSDCRAGRRGRCKVVAWVVMEKRGGCRCAQTVRSWVGACHGPHAASLKPATYFLKTQWHAPCHAMPCHGAPPLRWWARPCAWRLLQPLQRPSCRHPASAAWEGSSSAAD